MKILENNLVDIISTKKMLEKFGKVYTYVNENGVLYINEKAVESEQMKYGKHLTTEEIIEDMFRTWRETQGEPYTLWNELSRRHIDNKYRRSLSRDF